MLVGFATGLATMVIGVLLGAVAVILVEKLMKLSSGFIQPFLQSLE